MALTQDQMLRALHEADPRTLDKRYSPAELQAAYQKIVASKTAAPTPAPTPAPAPTAPAPAPAPTPVAPAPPPAPTPVIPAPDRTSGPTGPTPGGTGGVYQPPPPGGFMPPPAGPGPGTSTGSSSGPLVGPTGPNPNADVGGVIVGENDAYKQKFDETVRAGEQYGVDLVNKLGLQGQFLGNVREGPSTSYYDDLAALRAKTGTAGDPTALDSEALGVARNALQGLNSQENQALRSAAVADVNRQFGTQQQALMRYQGGTQPTSQRTAQLAQLGGARVDAQRSLARDLLIQNIQEKKDARNAFGSLTQSIGSRGDARSQGFSGMLQAGGQFADNLTMQGQQFNTGSRAQETAARTGALVGGVGASSALFGGYQAQDFQAKALQDALEAKDKEIQATKDINKQTLDAQERIMKQLAGKI